MKSSIVVMLENTIKNESLKKWQKWQDCSIVAALLKEKH